MESGKLSPDELIARPDHVIAGFSLKRAFVKPNMPIFAQLKPFFATNGIAILSRPRIKTFAM